MTSSSRELGGLPVDQQHQAENSLSQLSANLKAELNYVTTRLSFGNITLEYHHNGSNSSSISPLCQLERVTNSLPLEVQALRETKLSFFVVQDDRIFADAHRLAAPELCHIPVPLLPAPRLSSFNTQKSSSRTLNVLQFSTEPEFVDPFLYFLYWPKERESFIILKEGSRRANYVVTESVLDMLLAHSNLFGMHASSVSYKGQGVTFAGKAGSGKTSLTLAFIRAGAEFFSDDISIIDPQGSLLPFEHKKLTLRPPTVEYLKRSQLISAPPPQDESWESEAYMHVSEIYGREVYGMLVRVTRIILPVFSEKTERIGLTPLPPEQAITELRSCLLPWTMQWEDVYGLSGKWAAVEKGVTDLLASQQVEVLQLDYGLNLESAVRRIAQHLEYDKRGS